MTTKVKICGITNTGDAKMTYELGADYLGLIFPESSRRVSLKEAEKIAAQLSGKITLVGVFLDPEDSMITEVCAKIKLDLLQVYISNNGILNDSFPIPVLRSYLIRESKDLTSLETSGALLDFKLAPGLFKSIKSHPISLKLGQAILAGGLNNQNIDWVLNTFKPLGVDVARGVEDVPGKKDKVKLEKFIRKVKKWSPPIV